MRQTLALVLIACSLIASAVVANGSSQAQAAGHAVTTPNAIVVDARQSSEPGKSSFQGGASRSPDGHTLSLNSRYLLRDGKPWLPVMGEFHYTRVPEAEWEEQILKAKAAGVSILATYVIWIHHEEVEGQFDWTGRRDLRRFTELCKKHGMYVYVRIGPWAHGEVRNGGFPDWLLQKAPHNRENDPTYLRFVTSFYDAIGQQLKGELWKDGGPVIGVQLENEYAKRGPAAGEEHISELKRLAVAAGLDTPLYSVTGWDRAVVPHGAVIAVFGGYPDAPWDAALTDLPSQEVYAFPFGSPVASNMGMVGGKAEAHAPEQFDFPFITAEMGGGIEDTYHRRPVIQPDDIAAMMPVMLGSGVNLYGSYMFQGGENPDGKKTTLQESQRTGYATDVPVKSYDFQAPLAEFGQEREVLRKLKVFNYFLESFGPELAPMSPHAPTRQPASPQDFSVARVAVRSKGEHGFLFFNNYVRNAAMPTRTGFQVEVKLPDSVLRIPQTPVTLPTGSYGIWPFNMDVGGARLRYATAQPFRRFDIGGRTTFFFVATQGVATEFVWEDSAKVKVRSPGGVVKESDGKITVRNLQPALTPAMVVLAADGRESQIVLLSQEQAEQAWAVRSPSGEHLVLTPDQFYADGAHLFLERNADPSFHLSILPAVASVHGSAPLQASSAEGRSVLTAHLPSVHPTIAVTQTAAAGVVPPVSMGPPVSWRASVAMAPDDAVLAASARWSLRLPASDWDGVKDLFLRVDYDGDLSRLSADGTLLTDNFYNGQPWEVGLRRFRSIVTSQSLQLAILPRRADAPIFLEKPYREPGTTGQRLDLRAVTVIPQYQLTVDLP